MSLSLSYYRARFGDELTARANDFYPPTPSKSQDYKLFRLAYGDKKEESANSLSQLLRLDHSKKTCCIMAHMFVDGPHGCSDPVFDDYYQWLDATLAFAVRHPNVNWLVRKHPYEALTGQEKNFAQAVAPYVAQGKVQIVPNDIATSSLFGCVDAIVTVTGTAGIEFASVGIPCILAGKPFFGDCGFVIRTRTKEEYFAALKAIPEMRRLGPNEIALAKEVAYVYFMCLPIKSDILTQSGDLSGGAAGAEDFQRWWSEVAGRVSSIEPEQDLLYRCLKGFIHQNGTVLLNPELELPHRGAVESYTP